MEEIFELGLIGTGLKTAAMLFIVLGFLILVIFIMKKFLLPKGKAKGNVIIKTLSSLYLSPKDRVEVIEILGEKMVLSVTPGRVVFLTKLNDSDKDNKALNGKKDESGI